MVRYAATSVDVTPPERLPLAGYLARGQEPAHGVHDPLTASLLLLADDSGSNTVCWVTLDMLSVDTATATRLSTAVAERAGIARAAVLVCCSHTHSAPAAWLRPDLAALAAAHNDGGDAESACQALDRLVVTVADAAETLSTTAPASLSYTHVPAVGLGANRYDPAGPHESATGVLTVRDERGAVRAVAFDYACHPTVLGHDNLEYSADYLAGCRAALVAALGSVEPSDEPPVLAFLQGAAGDASTRFTRREQTFPEADRDGGILAGAVLRGALSGEAVAGAIPEVRRASVRVPTRHLPDGVEVAKRLADAGAEWRDAGDGAGPAARIARTRHEGALLLRRMVEAGVPAEVELPITVVTMGEAAWVHLPMEPFASYATAITTASPYPQTRVVGYTDGYFGYLADEPAHAAEVYEALSSVFDPAAGDIVVAAALDLLRS